MDVKPK